MISRSPAASWKTTFYVHLLAAEVLSARLRSPGTMATLALMGAWSSATRAACLSPCLCISVSLRLSSHTLCSHLLMAVQTVLLERTVTSLHPYFRFLFNVAPLSEVFREVTVCYGCWRVVLKQAKGKVFYFDFNSSHNRILEVVISHGNRRWSCFLRNEERIEFLRMK